MVADLLKNERLKEKGILPFHRLVETNLKFNRRLEKNRDLVNKRSLERGISNVQRYGRIYKSYSVNENSRSVEYRMSPGDHNFVGFNKIPTG